jgi:hypothetical protein
LALHSVTKTHITSTSASTTNTTQHNTHLAGERPELVGVCALVDLSLELYKVGGYHERQQGVALGVHRHSKHHRLCMFGVCVLVDQCVCV